MTANPRKRAIWDGDMSVCAGKPYRPVRSPSAPSI